MRRAALALPLVLALASAAEAGPERQCVEKSEALVGQRAGVVTRPLKKVRTATPEYPTRQGTTTAVSSIWIGEALVDATGTVREVWTIRPLSFDPAWPEFEAAIPAAVRKWSYEPPIVDGVATPACVTISFRINWG